MNLMVLSATLVIILCLAVYAMTRQNAIEGEIQRLTQISIEQLYDEYLANHRILNLFVLGGILLTGGFALTFFGGGGLDPRHWSFEQYGYAVVGLVATVSITLGQRTLYRSIKQNMSALLVTLLVLSFVIFSEIATTSEREASLVRDRSLASPTLQALLKNIETPDSNTITAPNTGYLAQYIATEKAKLANCETERCKLETQAQINSYQANLEQRQQDYQQTIDARRADKLAFANQATQLEYNEQNHSAIIRWIKENSAASFSAAMMFASLLFVIAFEAGYHFTGTKEGIYIEAISRRGYSVKRKAKRPTLVPVENTANQAPKQDTALTHKQNTHVHTPESEQKPTPQTYASAQQIRDMKLLYEVATEAKAGETIACPCCGTSFTKKTYNHKFHNKVCKDTYWNTIEPSRKIRA